MLWIKVRTAWKLGLPSLYRYFSFRLKIQTGLNPVRRLAVKPPIGPFFRPIISVQPDLTPPSCWVDEACYFGWFTLPLQDGPPSWLLNPFTGRQFSHPRCPWWQIPDFDPELGDTKTIWEPSRFEWVVVHALQAKAGQKGALERLNHWLADWLNHNPPYYGPNWKCGQEASIRVMHLAIAALILGQWQQPETGLLSLIRLHLLRIAPTIQYAVAQNNNHGTSEAAALFIGGSWLSCCQPDQQAVKWRENGRRWLEDRVRHLVGEDGSFSQYSVNYHRLLLDTLSIVELWRRHVDEKPFSPDFMQLAWKATQWLHAFTDGNTGDAPNLGANDGARLLPITVSDYRDYRPSVQMAAALFGSKRAYPTLPWPDTFNLLGIPQPTEPMTPPTSRLYDDGGYALLSVQNVRLFMRYPRFKFRPSHADALHMDLWVGGDNFLRDGGSFSYAADVAWQRYFRGPASHNTVQFDDRDQMPSLGRFLYGAWLQTKERSAIRQHNGILAFAAAYQDWRGALHHRSVELGASHLRVEDRIAGFQRRAILRWRLLPGEWCRTSTGWECQGFHIHISADVPILRLELVEGWESRYYLQRTPMPVLEAEVVSAGRIYTLLSW